MDWHLSEALDATQIQRWSERLGEQVVRQRAVQAEALGRGITPEGPLNPAELMVVGMDGGRVRMKDQDPDSQSRWKETRWRVSPVTLLATGRTKNRGSW
jgi:hypothetical protein